MSRSGQCCPGLQRQYEREESRNQMQEHAAFGALLAEGKTKRIYAYPGDDQLVYVVSKDQITAGDGARHNEIEGKSRWSTITTANVFRVLNAHQIATHFVECLDDVTLLVRH